MMSVDVNAQVPNDIYQGADYPSTRPLRFVPLATGQRDLSGLTIAYTLRLNGTLALQLLSTGSQVIVTGGTSSQVDVILTRAQTGVLYAVTYRWDLWIVTNGDYEPIAGGQQTVRAPLAYPPYTT